MSEASSRSQPRLARSAGNPEGALSQGRLFFGYFLLAKQKKVTWARHPGYQMLFKAAPSGANSGSRFCDRHGGLSLRSESPLQPKAVCCGRPIPQILASSAIRATQWLDSRFRRNDEALDHNHPMISACGSCKQFPAKHAPTYAPPKSPQAHCAHPPSAMAKTPMHPTTHWTNKVPTVTFAFWLIKILSTTVGETGADFLAVNAGFGTLVTDSAMALFLAGALGLQLTAHRHVPWIYWLTVVLVSVVGTQITDLLTDGLGVSLYLSTAVFAVLLGFIFAVWYRKEHTLSIKDITTLPRELFYWAAILCTFALGTAAGDLTTEALGLGFQWGVFVFGLLIALTAIAWQLGVNAVLTFWVAYILTRPLGAALGDLLSQSTTYGGLGLGAMLTSVLFLLVIVALVIVAQRQAMRADPAL